MDTTSYVYILASKKNGTLYIRITSDLMKRIWEHKNKLVQGFSAKYNVNKLVYYEQHSHIFEAIQREKSLKKWLRKWKLQLIEKDNPVGGLVREYLSLSVCILKNAFVDP